MGQSDGIKELDQFNSYLFMLARIHFGEDLKARASVSDLVQQTLLDAQVGFENFRGSTFAQQAAWLRKILINNAAKLGRDMRRQKRNIELDRSLDAAMARSSARLEKFVATQADSPSEVAIKKERLLSVMEALYNLPDSQQLAVLFHFVEGLSMPQVGQKLDCTSKAAANLLYRGLAKLREAVGNSGFDS